MAPKRTPVNKKKVAAGLGAGSSAGSSGAGSGAGSIDLDRGEYYLSFDCATKTLAYSICWCQLGPGSRDRLAAIRTEFAEASRQLRMVEALGRRGAEDVAAAARPAAAGPAAAPLKPAELDRVLAVVRALDVKAKALLAEVSGMVRLIDGQTVDLCPGRADADISTVERIRALARYVESHVRPNLRRVLATADPVATPTESAAAPAATHTEPAAATPAPATAPPAPAVAATVLIEYQMGQNAHARAIAAALTALFVEYEVAFVGPSLKNKIAFAKELEWCNYAEKYSTTYSANKNHAKANLAEFERLFGSGIPPSSAALRGHIADSFLQVLGYRLLGAGIEAASAMF